MYRDAKEIYNEANGIRKTIPKICDICNGKLERVSLYNDVVMMRKLNQETGKRDGKIFFVDKVTTSLYKDQHHYMLRCLKCHTHKEVIISFRTRGKNPYKKKQKIIQVF